MAWTLYYTTGCSMVSSWMRKPKDAKTLVALAWLNGVGDPSQEDITAFAALFERNGLSRDAALMALGTARGLLGRR